MSARFAVFAAVALSLSGPAYAQTDPYAAAHAAAANQLGVLEYCQARGDVGPDAVTAERSVISHLPASTANNDAAEALGKKGTMGAPNGSTMTLDSMASSRSISVSALCKQLGSAVIQSAAAFQQTGTAPGAMAMPAMPNGMTMPTMPAMPNGMTMPTMPGAPTPK